MENNSIVLHMYMARLLILKVVTFKIKIYVRKDSN
jgi:hypothetical protein